MRQKMNDEDTLTTKQLAKRWNMAPVTIQQWRVLSRGPKFYKIEKKVLYRLEEVRKYEQMLKMDNTAQYHLIPSKLGEYKNDITPTNQ
jgi:hypothetical protein